MSFIENSFIQPLVFLNKANAICPTYEVDKNVKFAHAIKVLSMIICCKNGFGGFFGRGPTFFFKETVCSQ